MLSWNEETAVVGKNLLLCVGLHVGVLFETRMTTFIKAKINKLKFLGGFGSQIIMKNS